MLRLDQGDLSVAASASMPPRDTLAKFTAFQPYAKGTTRCRYLAVMLLTLLPCLTTLLQASLIPLQDPLLGVATNAGFFASFCVRLSVVFAETNLQICASAGIAHATFLTPASSSLIERSSAPVKFPAFEAAVLAFYRLNDGNAIPTDDLLLAEARSIRAAQGIPEDNIARPTDGFTSSNCGTTFGSIHCTAKPTLSIVQSSPSHASN